MMKPPRTHLFRRGFTLIELLVVVAIIAVLIAILMPSLAGARSTARMAACGSNQRQIFMAVNFFAAERNGLLPGAGASQGKGFGQLIAFTAERQRQLKNNDDKMSSLVRLGYLPDYKVFQCPELVVSSHVIREAVAWAGWQFGHHYGINMFASGSFYDPNDYTACYGTARINLKLSSAYAPGTSLYTTDNPSVYDYMEDPGSMLGMPSYSDGRNDDYQWLRISPIHSGNKLAVAAFMDGHVENIKSAGKSTTGNEGYRSTRPFKW